MKEKQVTIVEFERDTISSEQGSDVLTKTTYKAHWGTAVNYFNLFSHCSQVFFVQQTIFPKHIRPMVYEILITLYQRKYFIVKIVRTLLQII